MQRSEEASSVGSRATDATARWSFASDNCAGICPEAWEAMAAANAGFAPGYGDDAWTQRASDLMRELFEYPCDVYFTFNGTAANSLALSTLCQPYHAIITHRTSHIETDECGGPEFFSHGSKLVTVGGDLGRLCLAEVEDAVQRRSDIHRPKPRAVSITQSTEMGTLYRVDDLDRVAEVCRRHRLHLQMDGARFANAAAALELPPKEVTWKAGVDVLCFGGTKNGMAVGECVVFFNRELSQEFAWRCKQAGQLASKMRYLAAPWVGMLETGGWLGRAKHANAMAQLLAARIVEAGVELAYPPEVNAVFARLSPTATRALRDRGWKFYDFIGGAARLMCSWQTRREDIDAFAADLLAADGRDAGASR